MLLFLNKDIAIENLMFYSHSEGEGIVKLFA